MIFKIGIIGLDTSHAVQFTRSLNQSGPAAVHQGYRVVAAYPEGSREIASSRDRIPGYTAEVCSLGVEIVSSLEHLLEKVDAVLLETNDGRLHLEQALPVLKAGKPMFIDKPVAASLDEVLSIYQLAQHFQTPLFSASTLRFTPGLEKFLTGELGEIIGCDTYSPCPLEPTHPDLFWYGIHGVELLLAIMGGCCVDVSRRHTLQTDLVTSRWEDGRIGTYRGRRDRSGNYFSGFGGLVHTTSGIFPIGRFIGYEPLLQEIIRFFRTGIPPVTPQHTMQVYSFMQAAELSKNRNGAAVFIDEPREQAEHAARKIVDRLLERS